jgi:hypothetical protein
MSNESVSSTWREKVTLAAVRGVLAGAAHAIIMWMLEH